MKKSMVVRLTGFEGGHAPTPDQPVIAAPSTHSEAVGRRLLPLQEEIVKGQQQRLAYEQMVARIQAIVPSVLAPGASVAVISKGDARLIEHEGMHGCHFPQDAAGNFAGHYPADSADAIRHLKELKASGIDHLLIPSTSGWWMEHYAEFGQDVRRTADVLHADDDCAIYRMRRDDRVEVDGPVPAAVSDSSIAQLADLKDMVERLLPGSGYIAVATFGNSEVLDLGRPTVSFEPSHLDGSAQPHAGGLSPIGHLENLRAAGAEFLVIPATAVKWFREDVELMTYLRSRYPKSIDQKHVCLAFDLRADWHKSLGR